MGYLNGAPRCPCSAWTLPPTPEPPDGGCGHDSVNSAELLSVRIPHPYCPHPGLVQNKRILTGCTFPWSLRLIESPCCEFYGVFVQLLL